MRVAFNIDGGRAFAKERAWIDRSLSRHACRGAQRTHSPPCGSPWPGPQRRRQPPADSLPAIWADGRRVADAGAGCRGAAARDRAGAARDTAEKLRAAGGRNRRLQLSAQPVQPAFLPRSDDYNSNISTIRHNLHSSWVVDSDPFRTNQLGHPYLGSMYHGFARSAGLNYWEALGYTFAGSALWEIAGEKTPPSRNDQINTGIGGTFLGEALFRMAHVVLAHDEIPPLWRELGAAVISPATGFNRLAFGNRFDGLFDSHDPVHYSKLQVGFSGTAQNDAGQSATNLKRNELLVDFAMDYGIPGKPGYTLRQAVRLLQLPGDRVQRQRRRKRDDTRAPGREGLRARTRLSRHLRPVRQLRLHRAANLSRLEHRVVARHDWPVVGVRRTSRCRARRCSARGTPRSARRTAPPTTTITTALRRRRCWRCA